jgi:hypothetical protein
LSEKQILNRLHELGRPEAIAKMLHFPIDTENTLGFACPICAAEPSESAAIITSLSPSGALGSMIPACSP